MNKTLIPALLVATIMVAGAFAFAPVEQASTVHLSGTVVSGTLTSSATATPIILEGATADDFETTITPTDPTADRTVTLSDDSGTVALWGIASTATATPVILEGATGTT